MSDGNGDTFSGTASITVAAMATHISITPANGGVFTGTGGQLTAQVVDQFGQAMASPTAYTWSATTLPAGAKAPSFNANATAAAQTTTATFTQAGAYGIQVKVLDASGRPITAASTVTMTQAVTGVSVSPASATVSGTSQQFSARAVDQFGKPMGSATTLGASWSTAASPGGAAAQASAAPARPRRPHSVRPAATPSRPS